MSAWDNYDNWLLKGSGVDESYPEVFETEKYGLFSCNEDLVAEFDDRIEKAIKDSSIYLKCTDADLESLEEYKDFLIDDEFFSLHADQYGAINEVEEHEQDMKEEAAERKGEMMRERRLLGDD